MLKKHMRITIFLTTFMLVLGYRSISLAGTLTIQTKTTVMTEGNRIKGSIKVINKGNVAAYNIQANITVLGKQIKTSIKKLLPVSESHVFEFETVLTGIKKGRFPLHVTVDFHDVNEYPFSAISCTTFFFQKDANPDLFCLINNLTIDRKGKLLIDLKNRGFKVKDIRATLILPRELSSPRPSIDFDIESRSQKTVEFTIENFYALSGASYPIFFVLEYDKQDTHYTALSSNVVKIEKKENWFWRVRWFWVAILFIFVTALLLYQLKKKLVIQQAIPKDLPDEWDVGKRNMN